MPESQNRKAAQLKAYKNEEWAYSDSTCITMLEIDNMKMKILALLHFYFRTLTLMGYVIIPKDLECIENLRFA